MALMHRASINDLSTLMYRAGNTALAIDGDRSVLLLRHVMRRLQRTAWRQRFLHDASIALFAGLLVAAVSVLLVRLSTADIAPRMVVIVTLVTSLAAALIITIVKRPSAMQVAIRADLALGLKQQFSTAWEFVADGRDPEVTLRLARAASSTRLAHQAGSAFPLHWPAPAKFIPVALIALMMTFVVELPADQAGVLSSDESAPGARALEPEVLRLGEQLRDFAQRMRQRAERDGLPRSQQIADELERLGQRMQEGTLNRERAITELKFATDAIDREYEAALTQGASVDAGIMTGTRSFQSLRRTAGLPDLERLSRRLARGELTEQDVQKLSENADTLMSLGVDSSNLPMRCASTRLAIPASFRNCCGRLRRTPSCAPTPQSLPERTKSWRNRVNSSMIPVAEPTDAQLNLVPRRMARVKAMTCLATRAARRARRLFSMGWIKALASGIRRPPAALVSARKLARLR